MKIIDNFLDIKLYNEIKELLYSPKFNWFYQDKMTNREEDEFYLHHVFYEKCHAISPAYNFIVPIFEKLNACAIVLARANTTIAKEKPFECAWHTDFGHQNMKTAILYFTTCNGYTVLDREKNFKVNSIENRIVIFDGNTEHKLVSQTDVKRRIVLNLNYYTP